MENNKLKSLTYLPLASTALFYVFFMASKHIPFLSNVTPFLEDPYDAVGSFSVLTAILIVLFNLVRLELIRKYKIIGRDLYIIRGNLVIGWSILATLLADCIAIINAMPHRPLLSAEKALFSMMALLFLLSIIILIKNYSAKRAMSVLQRISTETEIDVLFRTNFLASINPGKYPLRFSILFSMSLSLLLAAIEIIGEGAAPTFQQTALVFIILTSIGTVGFFIILILIGGYLGILGKIKSDKS